MARRIILSRKQKRTMAFVLWRVGKMLPMRMTSQYGDNRKKPGLRVQASVMFPWNNSCMDLCIPHSGHWSPVNWYSGHFNGHEVLWGLPKANMRHINVKSRMSNEYSVKSGWSHFFISFLHFHLLPRYRQLQGILLPVDLWIYVLYSRAGNLRVR